MLLYCLVIEILNDQTSWKVKKLRCLVIPINSMADNYSCSFVGSPGDICQCFSGPASVCFCSSVDGPADTHQCSSVDSQAEHLPGPQPDYVSIFCVLLFPPPFSLTYSFSMCVSVGMAAAEEWHN